MKSIFLLCVSMICSFTITAQTVYFTQDFNSSTSVAAYYGDPVTANKFNNIAVTGNTKVSITNNKLRFEKVNATDNNRGGFVRSTLFAGAPSTGAAFLKVSIEITISNNVADVPSGFQFSIGEMSGAPAAPNATATHSNIYINPTANAGEFKVATALKTSEAFSGTKTIIWYINNSGHPTGYMAPDGMLATVENDAADVWVADAGNQVQVVDEEPATTATINLKTFKFANNPNFTATIDIDDIVLSEEPQLPAKSIVSVADVPPVTVPIKTTFDKLPFPQEAEVTYDDNTKESIGVRWSAVGAYNMYMLGNYPILGTLVPRRGGINPNQVSVNTSVNIKEDIHLTNAFTPNGDGKNDVWINPELKLYRNVQVEVYDKDGRRLFQTTDPNTGWDGRNQNGEIISGSYFYIISVTDLSVVKKGVVTVIK